MGYSLYIQCKDKQQAEKVFAFLDKNYIYPGKLIDPKRFCDSNHALQYFPENNDKEVAMAYKGLSAAERFYVYGCVRAIAFQIGCKVSYDHCEEIPIDDIHEGSLDKQGVQFYNEKQLRFMKFDYEKNIGQMLQDIAKMQTEFIRLITEWKKKNG